MTPVSSSLWCLQYGCDSSSCEQCAYGRCLVETRNHHNTARAVVKQVVRKMTGYLLSMLTISSTQCQVDIANVALRMKDTHTHITDVKPFTKQFTTQWTALHLMVSILFSVFSQFVHYWLCAIFGDSVVFLCWNGRQFLVTTVAFSLIVTPLEINEQWKAQESGAERFAFPVIQILSLLSTLYLVSIQPIYMWQDLFDLVYVKARTFYRNCRKNVQIRPGPPG